MSDAPVALVTGAATGIGAACARRLAAEGFRVAVHYRSSAAKAEALIEELPDAFGLRADLTLSDNVNAPMLSMSLDQYDAVSAMSRGTWYLSKGVLRRFMLRAKSGRIINISSVVGHTGNPGQIPYTMVKAGLDAFTKSLAQELSGREILVNAVAPGFIDTEMTEELPPEVKDGILARIPQGRMGTADEVADVVSFLATRGHYVNGSVLHVNGGMYGG